MRKTNMLNRFNPIATLACALTPATPAVCSCLLACSSLENDRDPGGSLPVIQDTQKTSFQCPFARMG